MSEVDSIVPVPLIFLLREAGIEDLILSPIDKSSSFKSLAITRKEVEVSFNEGTRFHEDMLTITHRIVQPNIMVSFCEVVYSRVCR